MLKLLILTVVIQCLIQVTTQLSLVPKPVPTTTTTTMGPPPDRIHPDDVVSDPSNLPCSDTNDCPTGYGCRDSNGNIQYVQEGGWGGYGGGYNPFGPTVQGNCGCAVKPGEVCVGSNDCPKGYECYRQMSGVCCPPSYCVTTEYAQYWRNYWNNCFPPSCYFPAK